MSRRFLIRLQDKTLGTDAGDVRDVISTVEDAELEVRRGNRLHRYHLAAVGWGRLLGEKDRVATLGAHLLERAEFVFETWIDRVCGKDFLDSFPDL